MDRRPMARLVFVVAVCLLLSVARAQDKAAFPPPAPAKDPAALGLGIQRTMKLLATSTPQRRNKVRILFYGQSITEQTWSKMVADDLRQRFPNADLEIQNRAIGGFASQRLIWPAEHDLYPFYPDLLIFHVYGANNTYEQLVKNVRSRTTAEVLMQKDHVTAWPQQTPDEKANKSLWWDYMMNNVFLPEIAKKYGCGLADVRTPWVEYLKVNKLEPKALLKDGVHLNDQGNYLLAELVKRYLVYRPELPDAQWSNLVRAYQVGNDVQWKDGVLTLEFEGNRVDVAAQSAGGTAGISVLIDGKKPSEFASCYYIPRPSPGPWSPLFVSRVDHDKPLALEDWTLKVTAVTNDEKGENKSWSFEVAGSVTGPDGAGVSTEKFVSKSGRVRIETDAWFRAGKIPVGYTVKWKVLPLFVDSFTPVAVKDSSRESTVTLAQGLENGKHTLQLRAEGGGQGMIGAIRVYQPPVR